MTKPKPILSNAERAALPAPSPAPAIALINPQMGENIGAAARAMANFGLEELLIVNPRDGWPNEKAIAVSSGATWILDMAKIFQSTNEAIAEKNVVFATSGTPRQLDKPLISPQAAVKIATDALAKGQKPVVLFGSERVGLEQMDLISADYIVTYPTDFKFPSLNLAQSVAVFSYLWAVRDGDIMPDGWKIENAEVAERKFFDNMYDFLVKELDECGFFWPIDRRENMLETLRNPLVRARFSESEINLFRGAMRVISEGPRRRFSELQRETKAQSIRDFIGKIFPNSRIIETMIENQNANVIIDQNGDKRLLILALDSQNQIEIISNYPIGQN